MHPRDQSIHRGTIMKAIHRVTEVLAACQRSADTSWQLACGGLVGRQAVANFRNFLPLHPGQTDVLLACQQLANTIGGGGLQGLWLIGPPGTGKTHLGSATVSHVRERGLSGHIHCCRAMLRMLRTARDCGGLQVGSSPERAPLSEKGVLELLGAAELLVLDNVGVGPLTDDEAEHLFDIIDLRYKHCLPTVLISNLDVGGIRTALGERSFDRLREGARVLTCTWPSHRGR